MLSKNIKIFIKQLLRNKAFSFITIAGFSFALMFVILLSLYIKQETSIDKFHEKKDRIYRLVWERGSGFAPPVGDWLKGIYPEIESYTRFHIGSGFIGKSKDNIYSFRNLYVDSDFFSMFSFRLIEGNPDNVFADRNSVVLFESFAHKLFGSENPIGHEVEINQNHKFIVTGIVEDFENNTQFEKADLIFNFPSLATFWGDDDLMSDYGNSSFGLYLLEQPNADLRGKKQDIFELFSKDYWLFSNGFAKELRFERLDEVYFGGHSGMGIRGNSRLIITVFSSIVVLILILAIINYVNLSMAQASLRSREIAVKKLFGSTRLKILGQFVVESVLLCLLAFNFGLLLAKIAEPSFNTLLDTELNLNDAFYLPNVLVSLSAILAIGVISGIVPAYLMSKLQALDVLKGIFRYKSKGVLSKVLISFQYCAAIALIASTWVVARQTNYLRNFDLGFSKDNIVYFSNAILPSQKNAYRNELLRIPGVEAVSFTAGSPMDGGNNNSFSHNGKSYSFQDFRVDSTFFNIFQIESMPTGAAYSKGSYWLNETAVKELGIDRTTTEVAFTDTWKVPVYGVVKDFHFRSLYQPIGPAYIRILPEEGYPWVVFVKIGSENQQDIVAKIKNVHSQFTGGLPLDVSFVDERVASWYEKEERNAKLIGLFSILAIVISIMGIFGMAAFYITQRIKEVGIRKVNGATDLQIMGMLNAGFIKWVVVAMVLATPIAYFAMDKWLQTFAYKTSLSWWIFAASGLGAIAIALLTVSGLSYKASTSNPVKALRHE